MASITSTYLLDDGTPTSGDRPPASITSVYTLDDSLPAPYGFTLSSEIDINPPETRIFDFVLPYSVDTLSSGNYVFTARYNYERYTPLNYSFNLRSQIDLQDNVYSFQMRYRSNVDTTSASYSFFLRSNIDATRVANSL